MKKLTVILSILMLAAGCSSNGATKLKDTSAPIIAIGGTEITHETLYQSLRLSGGSDVIYEDVIIQLLDKDVVLTEEQIAEAQTSFEETKEAYGDSFSIYLTAMGYENEEDYFNDIFLVNKKYEVYIYSYLDTRFDEYVTTFKPVKIRMFATASDSTAAEALQAIKEGTSFEEVAAQYTVITQYGAEQMMYTESAETDVPTIVKDWVYSQASATMTDEALFDSQAGLHYIVKIEVLNASEMKDEVRSWMSSTFTELTAQCFYEGLSKYNFGIYDKAVYDAFNSSYPGYLIPVSESE
ncbi:MAG: hypothetical protein LBR25_04505 [Erysipelotrichaceae bacterium]|jgi:hypothetical protein|nr:hypothetical protein [Erysipelotrichaceae bacterium]